MHKKDGCELPRVDVAVQDLFEQGAVDWGDEEDVGLGAWLGRAVTCRYKVDRAKGAEGKLSASIEPTVRLPVLEELGHAGLVHM
jgi:hypothetical protein